MPNRRSGKGITVVELLIVLALVAILSAIAVPAFISYLQKTRLTGAANRLYYTLQYAKSEAIKRNIPVFVSFQTGSNWCYGVNSSTTCTCNVTNSCGLGSASVGSAGQLTMTATGLTSNSIRFEPTHGATQANSTITLTTPQSIAVTVQVSRMGGMILCSSQVEGYQACT